MLYLGRWARADRFTVAMDKIRKNAFELKYVVYNYEIKPLYPDKVQEILLHTIYFAQVSYNNIF